MQDALADDREAEVTGLDHAGVDRADRDLVGVVARDGDRPCLRVGGMVEQWAHGLMPVEAHAVAVVRLALVLTGRGEQIDHRVDHPSGRGRADDVVLAAWAKTAVDLQTVRAVACEQSAEASACRGRCRSHRERHCSCGDGLYLRPAPGSGRARAHAMPPISRGPAWLSTSR